MADLLEVSGSLEQMSDYLSELSDPLLRDLNYLLEMSDYLQL